MSIYDFDSLIQREIASYLNVQEIAAFRATCAQFRECARIGANARADPFAIAQYNASRGYLSLLREIVEPRIATGEWNILRADGTIFFMILASAFRAPNPQCALYMLSIIQAHADPHEYFANHPYLYHHICKEIVARVFHAQWTARDCEPFAIIGSKITMSTTIIANFIEYLRALGAPIGAAQASRDFIAVRNYLRTASVAQRFDKQEFATIIWRLGDTSFISNIIMNIIGRDFNAHLYPKHLIARNKFRAHLDLFMDHSYNQQHISSWFACAFDNNARDFIDWFIQSHIETHKVKSAQSYIAQWICDTIVKVARRESAKYICANLAYLARVTLTFAAYIPYHAKIAQLLATLSRGTIQVPAIPLLIAESREFTQTYDSRIFLSSFASASLLMSFSDRARDILPHLNEDLFTLIMTLCCNARIHAKIRNVDSANVYEVIRAVFAHFAPQKLREEHITFINDHTFRADLMPAIIRANHQISA
jgi:hypothetical protein